MLSHFIEKRWYSNPGLLYGLLPLEALFSVLSKKRRRKLEAKSQKLPVTTIVVGNVSVGGTGKTPVLIALVNWLKSEGYSPGVVSKGYGRQTSENLFVKHSSTPEQVGDEPLLIFKETECAVIVGENRVESGRLLVSKKHCDVILTDDGLQDYSITRDMEIIIVDGLRNFGNGHLLPVGPLREPPERVQEADFVLVNGGFESSKHIVSQYIDEQKIFAASVIPIQLENIKTNEVVCIEKLSEFGECIAVAGIGNPEKFYNTLSLLDVKFAKKSFPDHYTFSESDFADIADKTIIMTSKDAVKCQGFARDNWWHLKISIDIPPKIIGEIKKRMKSQKKAL